MPFSQFRRRKRNELPPIKTKTKYSIGILHNCMIHFNLLTNQNLADWIYRQTCGTWMPETMISYETNIINVNLSWNRHRNPTHAWIPTTLCHQWSRKSIFRLNVIAFRVRISASLANTIWNEEHASDWNVWTTQSTEERKKTWARVR